MNERINMTILAALLGVAFTTRLHPDTPDPLDFTSLGTFDVTNGSYVLLSATNVATPLINWVPASPHPFDASGDFLLTHPINPSQPQEFYRLQPQ